MEYFFILLLILANGVLALSEIAIISARKSKLQHLADKGNRKAKTALDLAASPEEFLSTVQIGITLVGILAGVFGGATIAETLEAKLRAISWLAPYGRTVSFGIVVGIITYLSLVVGELVPKQLALGHPERVALMMAKPMRFLSRITKPAVWILSASSGVILKLLRIGPIPEPVITEEEIKLMIRQGTQKGIFHKSEKEMIDRILLLSDRQVASVMTPRPDIEWLDLSETPEECRKKIVSGTHSRLPVGEERLKNFLGVVYAKDLLKDQLEGKAFDIRSNLKQPLFVPETTDVMKALDEFRKANTQFALVVDEYGGISGLLTLNDILQAVVGHVPSEEEEEPAVIQREDGTWLIDGMFTVEDFCQRFPGDSVFEEEGDYHTLAGYILMKIGRIPSAGDHIESGGLRFEVVDMDGNRIDKVLVSRQPVSPKSEQ